MKKNQQKITPFLWFDNQAEEAVKYYISIFAGNKYSKNKDKDNRIEKITYYDEVGSKVSGMPKGMVMTVEFLLDGQKFVALNGGPYFKFSGAVSFMIDCQNQEEIDYFWGKLSQGGEGGDCGWINRDKFGLTWQVVPSLLDKYLSDPDPEKAKRVLEAMLKMKKIIIKDLEDAYGGKENKKNSKKLFIDKTIKIKADVARVWEVLTNSKLNREWVGEFSPKMKLQSDWKIGSAVLWRESGGKVVVEGNVTEIKPERFLRFTVFDVETGRTPAGKEDGITFELSERLGKTTLNLRHGDFATMPEGKKYYKMTLDTWKKILPRIKQLAEKN